MTKGTCFCRRNENPPEAASDVTTTANDRVRVKTTKHQVNKQFTTISRAFVSEITPHIEEIFRAIVSC